MHKINKVNDDLVRLLVRCRVDRKMTLTHVARAIGMSVGAISQIERSRTKPNRTTRLKLEDFLRRHGYFPKTDQEAA